MEMYEVKYQLYPSAGYSVLISHTVQTTNPEEARKQTYKMVLRNKPVKAKAKFLYVRKLSDSNQ